MQTCKCKHASTHLLKKEEKKQRCQGENPSLPRCTCLCAGQQQGKSLPTGAARATSGCSGSSEPRRPKCSLRFFHPRWIHSESKPSTWPAAPLTAFFVCLMILDQPFSLGSACIASPPPFYKCCRHPLRTRH